MNAAALPVQKAWLGWAAIALASCLGAGNFVVSRYIIKASINANDMTALRFAAAGILLLPLLWRQGIGTLAGLGLRRGLVMTTLAGAPFSLVMLWGLHFAPAAHGAVLIPGSVPVYTAIGMWLVFGVRISLQKMAAFSLVLAGLALVTGFSGDNTPGILFGDLLFATAGAAWSAYTILLRRWHLDGVKVASVVSVLSLGYLPFYFLLTAPALGGVSYTQIALVTIYQGVFLSIGALMLYSTSVRHIGPQRTVLGNASVPVLAALLAVPVLGEMPAPLQWLGIALAVAGVIFAARIKDDMPMPLSLTPSYLPRT